MADQVQIKLGADVSQAVAGIERVSQAGSKLKETMGVAMKTAMSELAGAAGQAGSALQDLSTSLGLSAGAATAAIAVGLALKASIEFYTETINIATQGMRNLGDSTYKTGENLKKLIQESKKAGLIDDDEALGFLKNIASGKAASQDPDKAARMIAAVTRELRHLLDVRREIAALQKAQDKSNLMTTQGDSLLASARAGLAGAEIGAAGLSPEEEEKKRIEVLNELHKLKLREFEQEEIASNRRKDLAVAAGDKIALIEIEADLLMHSKKVEASWLELSAKEVEIRRQTVEKRKRIDEDAEQQRIQKLQEEEDALSRIYEIERARIAGDFRLTDTEKRQKTIDSLNAEAATLTGGGQSKRAQQQLGFLKADADPNSMKDQTIKALVELKSAMGTAAQNISQVFVSPIQGAFTGLQGSIAGLIKGTMTWKDAMRNVAASIVEQLISAIAMLIAKAIILTAVIGALNVVAPGFGSILAGGMIGARASGGITGPGLYTVGERGPEYVVNNETTNRMGQGFFDSLQAGYTPPSAGGGGGSSNVHIGFIGGPSMVGQWLESREGRKYVANIADERIREARG